MTIAVIGAGIMGSQIALEFANNNFQVLLFDQTAKNIESESKNQLAINGINKALDNISNKEILNNFIL